MFSRVLIAVLIVVIATSLAARFLIPNNLKISVARSAHISAGGATALLNDSHGWAKWWTVAGIPATSVQGNSLVYARDTFQLVEPQYGAVRVRIRHGALNLSSVLRFISVTKDSTTLFWETDSIANSNNPLTRYQRYQQAKHVHEAMARILDAFVSFSARTENIYGIHVDRTSIRDSVFISTRAALDHVPNTPDIYTLVRELQAHVTERGVTQTGEPIFHVDRPDSGRYELMVAIPVTKPVADEGRFSVKHMVQGSFLVTEVRGGDSAVNRARRALHRFFTDYGNTSMAINFTMLITDRLAQPDSSKWVTRLYEPVY